MYFCTGMRNIKCMYMQKQIQNKVDLGIVSFIYTGEG